MRVARPRPFDPGLAPPGAPAVGVDEVGRGAWCGPVVVAAVWFDPAALPPDLLAGLDDSKRLTPMARARLAAALLAQGVAVAHALAAASAARIDAQGLTAATHAAMAVAVRRLQRRPGAQACPVLIDGRDTPPGLAATPVIGGDRRVAQIAAASIIAKVTRDRAMARLDARRPGWGWATNVGYGVPAHGAALALRGPTPHHRLSFRPVAAAAR